MPKISFYSRTEIADELLQYAVIAAQYNGQWIFCRHKQRSTWEIPGGHREQNCAAGREPILDTARRELCEETGASEFEMQPLCVYSVTQQQQTTYALLCLARVTALAGLDPQMEIGEIALLDTLPQRLTYPEIQPELYRYVQGWLNMQSNPDELWDVYDANRRLTGRTHRRGEPMPKGEYHLAVHVWVQNRAGEFLLTKRTPNKGFPNMWECSGGSALAGEDSLTAAVREVKEETGLTVLPENGNCVLHCRRDDYFLDVWLFKQDFDISQVVLQKNETCGAICAAKEQLFTLNEEGKLVPFAYSYLPDLFKQTENR